MVDEDPTRVDAVVAAESTGSTALTVPRVDVAGVPSVPTGERFVECGLLGVGGMGEVHELLDRRLGRVVARKRMTKDAGRARFIREVRIQAQLEHPAIVPVYNFDKHEGRPTFTMKRVQGRTLDDVLQSDQTDERHAPRRLLEALANVALAVDYAHSRGVVHRDLKPANIMLGDWGEVYVLDWGVARVLHQDEADAVRLEPGDVPGSANTALVGTVGYMPPETIRGDDAGSVRSDVYALGCILFHIATGVQLHPGGSEERIASTLAGGSFDERLRDLRVEPAPELVSMCRRATGPAHERHPTARAFHDELKRYLDGDRDLVLRRDMADELSERAGEAIVRAGRGDRRARREALRSLSAALALSPEHHAALRGLVRLLTEPPREVPDEVRERIALNEASRTAAMARPAATTGVALILSVGFLVWMGVRSWASVAVMVVTCVLAMWAVLSEGRRAARGEIGDDSPRRRGDVVTLLAIGVSIGTITLATSPWLFVPPVVIGVTILRVLRDHRQTWLVGLVMCASVFVPWILEVLAVLPASTSFESGTMLIHPLAVRLPGLPTQLLLLLCVLVGVPVSIRTTRAFRSTLTKAELDVELHAWQLRQMLPEEASASNESEAGPEPS